MSYIKINLSNQDVVNIVKEKIQKSIPFSLTRFGDGEIFILNRNQPKEVQQRYCKNWGYQWPNELEMALDAGNKILKSALHSDVIGIMSPDYLKQLSNGMKYSQQKWSIDTQVFSDLGINPNKLKVCNHQLPRMEEFGDPNNFKEIVQNQPINIVTPNVDKISKDKLSQLLDTKISITKIDRKMSMKDRKEYFRQLDKIKETIVIFGGAAGSKDTATYLKKHGKISLDFGATLDAWSGIQSRPWFGSKQKHCLI